MEMGSQITIAASPAGADATEMTHVLAAGWVCGMLGGTSPLRVGKRPRGQEGRWRHLHLQARADTWRGDSRPELTHESF